MALDPGSRIGSYEITAQIGVGGMGEVYRATDTNLKRQVAIKVLPASVSGDVERLARFQREAEVLAALNHPHIAAIYGLEKATEFTALVMELVEGEDLLQRIVRGAIPPDEALAIAKQIAEALEAAHEHGIIHRDLKPANIKVRADGTVKVLDFGLAKAMEPTGLVTSSIGASLSPTITTPAMTQMGMILGTAAYMSPEQARGKPLDRRTDVWAFGCVLYEMLTGRRAFEGDDITVTLARVVEREPDWTALPAALPAPIRRLLRRCLEKDRKRRLDSAADARLELDEALSAPAGEASLVTAAAPARPTMLQRVLTIAPWLLVLVLGAAWFASSARSSPPVARPALRFPVDLGSNVDLGNVPFALSPDGTRLVVRERGADQRVRLVIRPLDGGEPRVLSGTEGAQYPSFSGDGEWLGFVQSGKLTKASVQGGAPVPLCEVLNSRGLSWDADGSIVVAADRLGGLSRCPADGGALEPSTRLEAGETSHRWPQILPMADAVLFTSAVPTANDPDANSVVVQRLDSGQRKTLWKGGTYGRYLPSGHLVFVSQNTLFAAPFDLTRLELVGTPRPVVRDVGTSVGSDSALFDVSQTGVLAFSPRDAEGAGERAVVRLDSAGVKEPLLPGESLRSRFRLSPDGRRGASVIAAQGLWIYDLERHTRSRLAGESGNRGLDWSRDGRYVFFETRDARRDGIAVVRADGTGNPVSLIDQRNALAGLTVSPDGTHVVFGEVAEGGRSDPDLWSLPIDLTGDAPRATGEPKPFLSTPSIEAQPEFSRDGRWLAYVSDESGRPELFVRVYPGAGGKVQISGDGLGTVPVSYRWSPDGKDLLYVNTQGQLMAVAYTVSGSTFMPGASRKVTDLGPQDSLEDIAPDGKSFVIGTPSDNASASARVTFVLNFFDEIRRRLTAGPSAP